MGKKTVWRKVLVHPEDLEEEFNRGLAEWDQWIRDETSRQQVIRRRFAATDELEQAFFVGVLTGAKRSGKVFAPSRNWKGEVCGDFGPPPQRTNPNPRMVRRKR